ncbi:MAG TPA: diacylglycerol kinase family protein [Planctomycetota bacterium]|nr:diacylglycerol kinase family protein [Planctomycetota bacterium]
MARDLVGSNQAPLSLLVNPAAGRGRRQAERLAAELARAGMPFSLQRSERPGHLRELAAAARGPIVAVGGDGTVNEVVDGLVPRDGRLGPLAILASGRGDDFAASAGFGSSAAHLVERLAARSTRLVDVAVAAIECEHGLLQRRFANYLGMGFDAEVARAAGGMRLLRGRLLYLAATARALWRQRAIDCDVSYEGTADLPAVHEHVQMLFGAVCNGRRVGGGLRFAPHAELDDGLLDVLRVTSASRRRTLLLLWSLVRVTHLADQRVRLERCRAVTLRSARPVVVALDGEPVAFAARSVRAGLAPERLELIGW